MNKYILSLIPLLLLSAALVAQVNIDKTISLTGTGADGKVTGIKEVTAAKDAVSAEVLQNGSLVFAATGASTGTAYNLTLAPGIASYSSGFLFSFIASTPNTGSLTLNVNGIGTRTVKKYVSNNLSNGDILAGQLVTVIYDGTNFQLISKENAQSPSRISTLVYTADGF